MNEYIRILLFVFMMIILLISSQLKAAFIYLPYIQSLKTYILKQVQMELPNPYLSQPCQDEEQSQPFPYAPSYADSYDDDDHGYRNFNDDYQDYLSQPSPSFPQIHEKHQEEDAHSEHIPHKRTEKYQVSGIHEKYLKTEHRSLEKQSFRSERKAATTKPYVNKFKKTTNEATPPPNDLNPISQGLMALQIESAPLKEQIISKTQSEQQKMQLFTQLGLKQPKVLGKAKTERELQNLLAFLESGELPEEYIADFLVLVSA